MTNDLLRETWAEIDSYELRFVLDKLIGGPGQYADRSNHPNELHLPLAGPSCRIVLTFRGNKIIAIQPGQAFVDDEWRELSNQLEKWIFGGSLKVGREYSFSTSRVLGSWRGTCSGVQILPARDDAPRASIQIADHPFILEFSIRASEFWLLTNHRRMREHRNMTLLLNVLLATRVSHEPRQSEHFWAYVRQDNGDSKSEWAQRFFAAPLGDCVIDELSPPSTGQLEEREPEEYYTQLGHDGKGLRVPADLDESICLYLRLSPRHRAKFDRAMFWLDLASRQWTFSVSASFASLVSAVEALTDRGTVHRVFCETCRDHRPHEAPGAVERFRSFFDEYAPDPGLRKRRSEIYSLRSGILHGNKLMQIDQDRAFGWDPPSWNERELRGELGGLTRVALRNWLKSPPTNRSNRRGAGVG